jgi:hypothetical protein
VVESRLNQRLPWQGDSALWCMYQILHVWNSVAPAVTTKGVSMNWRARELARWEEIR